MYDVPFRLVLGDAYGVENLSDELCFGEGVEFCLGSEGDAVREDMRSKETDIIRSNEVTTLDDGMSLRALEQGDGSTR